MKIVFLEAENWAALYIDGQCKTEQHQLDLDRIVSAFTKAGLDAQYFSVDEEYFADKDRLEFPRQFKDMPKKFLSPEG